VPTTPGRPRRRTRLARALALDRNPLRRASDRAEAWIRIGLLAVFLIAGPIAALSAGGWAYHAGSTTARAHAAPARHAEMAPRPQAPVPTYLDRTGQGSQTRTQARSERATSARSDEAPAVLMTLALMALTLLAAHRLVVALLTRRRLAAWETAWSRVGPQWSRGRP